MWLNPTFLKNIIRGVSTMTYILIITYNFELVK